MREIKFRGKRLENGEWVYGGIAFFETYIYITHPKEEDGFVHWFIGIDAETVGQYTELKDSNGREIYEGDILSWEGYPPAIVSFIEGTFSVFDSTSDDTGQLLIEVLIGAEVTGNIHDNPELLEGER